MSDLKLDGIKVLFGPFVAVNDLCLDVRQGEFISLLGPSGSGKSTLLGVMSGLVRASAGTITLAGQDVTDLPPAARNIGLVFQSYALFPHLSVYENVAFPLRVRGVDKQDIRTRVREALAMVRLEDFGQRRPNQLSGGQQQRVALARAIVFRPKILLLDEPLGALDSKLREEVRLELRQLQRSIGITTILVTHDQEEALSLSDRVAILSQGRLEQIGTPTDLYLRPESRFVAEFIGTANLVERQLAARGLSRSAPLPDGDMFVVRPERVLLGLDHDGATGISAWVRDVIFLGSDVRYHLETDLGHSIVATARASDRVHVTGGKIKLTWAQDALFPLASHRKDTAAARPSPK